MAEQKNVQEQDINQLLKVRREKLADLQENGKDPFVITKFDVTNHSTDIKENYEQMEGQTVTVAGKCCESGDLVQEHTQVAPVTVGDTLAVLSTGAYNYSMASNYNRIPRPGIVMVNNGKSRVIVKRESYEDIVRNDI